MSSRARRLRGDTIVTPFPWRAAGAGPWEPATGVQELAQLLGAAPGGASRSTRRVGEMAEGPADTGPANDAPATDATPPAEASAAEPPAAAAQARLAAIEREAFEKGFAAGERAGTEAGAQRAEGILRRLGETLDELGGLRRVVLERSERDLVRLALAIARRVIGREIQMDPEYVAALTHVALDRLAGQEAPATVRVNPDDYQKLEGRLAARAGGGVRLVADATVRRGGCLIESEFGSIDASVDAQLDELSRGLLGESHARDPRAA